MCGLVAAYTYRAGTMPLDPAELMKMREAMIPRGPDGAGLWVAEDKSVGLAHRRLAILDVTENGAQPMVMPDGKLRIVFNGEIYNYRNGEIYNYRDLRDRLKAKGHVFTSDTDTEVLLYAYREYGQGMVDDLRGMFAFALWDEEKRGLLLARDHFGIKPLYFHDDGDTLRVSSQVKGILAGGGIEAKPEPAGHVGFFSWGCVPEPYTLYRDLFALPAGHTLWVGQCGPRAPRRYFDIAEELEQAAATKVEAPVAEILKESLRDSVKHHLIAEVPVGVFLSSGVDSATVAALASEEVNQVQAVTLGFDEYENSLTSGIYS